MAPRHTTFDTDFDLRWAEIGTVSLHLCTNLSLHLLPWDKATLGAIPRLKVTQHVPHCTIGRRPDLLPAKLFCHAPVIPVEEQGRIIGGVRSPI